VAKLCVGCKAETSSITKPSLVGFGYRAPPGGENIRCFCLFFAHPLLNDKDCERHFAIKTLETSLASLDRGMFVGVHPLLTFSMQRWAEPPQNDKVKNGKIEVLRVFACHGRRKQHRTE